MSISRRDLVKVGGSAAALAVIPRPLLARIGARPEPVPLIEDPRLKPLAQRALDAARTAGASYADVRLTHTRTRGFGTGGARDTEGIVVGVRALAQGYWGFASGPVWSPDEMVRLGREAVHQAKTNALGGSRVAELAPTPAVSGHWTMPVKIDPFALYPAEIMDYLGGLNRFIDRLGWSASDNQCRFSVQEKAFASTDGSFCTQRLYLGLGNLDIEPGPGQQAPGLIGGKVDLLSAAGLGWELYRDQPLREAIRRLIDERKADAKLPLKPIDVGRYDTVVDARTVTRFVTQTLGRATELDRALGYEANAGGTSYLTDPLEMLGSYQAGAPLLTLTANRTEAGAAATVNWDDEGVVPDDFTIVKDGVLTDFQTTRESAAWLKDQYTKSGRPLRSHGCSHAPSGLESPLQHAPNLTLAPGGKALDFDALVAGVSKGIAVKEGGLDMDFQNLSGLGTGQAFEIKGGKRVARIASAGFLFRAPELWKSLLAAGGAQSAERYGLQTQKGEPAQGAYHSVTAVPAVFKQLTFIDPLRKA